MSNPKEVTCLNCGWVAFEYSRAEAINAVRRFNEWYSAQRDEVKRHYIPLKLATTPSDEIEWEKYHSKIENYEYCSSCGGSYKNFKDAKAEDTTMRFTVSPIIPRDE